MDKWIGFEFTPNWIDCRLRITRKSDVLAVDEITGVKYAVYECAWADTGSPAAVIVAEHELPRLAIAETHRRWRAIWRDYTDL